MALSVLFVCTGNVCRSPMAERLLRHRLGHAAPIIAASAGTRALTGRPIDGPSALALRELGGDSEAHVAQRLTGTLIAGADVILTAESVHRAGIVQAHPQTFRRVFTIREFGRLGGSLGPLEVPVTETALRARVRQVADQRGTVAQAEHGGDEIGDPFGAPVQVARVCAAQLAEAVDAVIAALGLEALM